MKSPDPVRRVTLGDGATLHFVERGRGPALILLHGGMGDLASWAAQQVVFSRKFRTFAYSRRHSHPNRNPDTVERAPALADAIDLQEFMARLDIQRAHLVGTSYGALVALTFATRWPDQARSLVLAEPPLHAWVRDSDEGAPIHDRFMHDVWVPAATHFRHGADGQAMALLDRSFSDGATPGRDAYRNVRAMKALALSGDPFPRLDPAAVGALRMPMLVLRGEHCDTIHGMGATALARVRADARIAIVPAAGHRSHRDNPDAFNAIVLGFLARAEGARPAPRAGRLRHLD